MAAIDKIYLTSYKDYLAFREWCEAQSPISDKYGHKEFITEYLFYYDEPWEGEHPVFSAPCFIDAYLIRNCPVKAIQDCLKNHNYGDSYEKIKNGELYASPEAEVNYEIGKHCKITKLPFSHKYNYPIIGQWLVDIITPEGIHMWYHTSTDTWDNWSDYVVSDSISSAACIKSLKTLIRKITKKWKLPVGTIVRGGGRYEDEDYEIIVKK